MSRNLTPIMLVIGPLMLVGAFFSWPLQNEVGMEAVELLRDDASIVWYKGGSGNVPDVRWTTPALNGYEEGR